MTKKEARRLNQQEHVLLSLGFTIDEAESLRRISKTLHRWYELECGDSNGCIERDEDNGKPYWRYSSTMHRDLIPDRERGAKQRLSSIMNRHPELKAYIQGDPRGATLYIIRPGDVPTGKEVDSYYDRGIAVY